MALRTATLTTSSDVVDAQPFRFRFFRSIAAAGADWDSAAPAADAFLQRPYLEVIEAYPPLHMRVGYLVFYKQDAPIGVALCQIQYFSGKNSLRVEEMHRSNTSRGAALADRLKARIAGFVHFHILICGNLLVTGAHGYAFDETRIERTQAIELLDEAMKDVASTLKREEGIRVPVMLYKDLRPEWEANRATLRQRDCLEFVIQPNMVLPLPYPTFEEYLGAMTTKYRTRAKRAFKKAQGLEKRELTLADIVQWQDLLFAHYKGIADSAGFNMVALNPGYFAGLKRLMSDAFRVFAYFDGDKLIAFFTTIYNYGSMDAHFLGYDKSYNHDRQLYLNMLYDIVRVGIASGCSEVVFARTALEIKSSVGAEPNQLYCFVRHRSRFVNRFGRSTFRFMNTSEAWTQRHPFKHEEEGHSE
ncbi:MAG: GNAT family N-acetyltransferase [Saprospiraceae bacterium]